MTPDVGKIQEWPDICLRCADVMETNFKNTGIYKDIQNTYKDHPIRKMKNTTLADRLTHKFHMVYMDEKTFIDIYKDEIKFLKQEE